jgi:hypothetical protein
MLFWMLIGIDAVLLLFGFYMAINAVEIVSSVQASAAALGIAALYLALPVFCLAAPYSGWRALSRSDESNAVAIAAMPIVYAAFLTLMTFWQ